ncbi:hypothetical protein H6B10_17990, partial [Gemmiger formicilis]|nr:hypothetical protein [Gemmiger formicilis]
VPSGNDVQLHGVRFAYPEKPDQPILQNIDLSIAPGKFIQNPVQFPQRAGQLGKAQVGGQYGADGDDALGCQ